MPGENASKNKKKKEKKKAAEEKKVQEEKNEEEAKELTPEEKQAAAKAALAKRGLVQKTVTNDRSKMAAGIKAEKSKKGKAKPKRNPDEVMIKYV